jgi:hypothetical protein
MNAPPISVIAAYAQRPEKRFTVVMSASLILPPLRLSLPPHLA